jgi:tetratricopeptide (TPR) repeat protein
LPSKVSKRTSKATPPPSPPKPDTARTPLLAGLILLLATLAVYASVRHFDFVNFDDPDYVTNNPHVRGGLSASGLAWAFTSTEAANWFPLSRFSHMLDCQLFGFDAGWHHLSSVLFHALATLFLFAFLQRATRELWRSALVAALFALHPLHVESVAWVAERKDVLSACFWFLGLWAYVRYTERPGAGRYSLVLGAFALGLMSKPMIVTLPLLLVLLDLWPLRRGLRLREKIPFFALAAAGALATFVVQRASGAVQALGNFPVGLRIENALVTYTLCILKTLWPSRLAVFYPYPAGWPLWQTAAAVLALAGISYLAWRNFPTRPYLAAGWLWYLVTLLPVIGLVQVGAQARADRYMYVPMVGLAIILAWSMPKIRATAVASVAACLALATVTWAQVEHWRDSETLFRHALEVTDNNPVAEHNLGVALTEAPGKLPEAVLHLEKAVHLAPDSAKAHTDLGSALARLPGRSAEAVAEYKEALRLAPGEPIPLANLGGLLSSVPGGLPEAIADLEAALRANPGFAEAHNNLAGALANLPGRLPQAIAEYQTALQLKPDYPAARNGLVAALTNLGSALAAVPERVPAAITQYQAALHIDPDNAEVHYNLGATLAGVEGRLPEAIAQLETAIRLRPNYAEAHNNLGVLLSRVPGRLPDAISHFDTALRLKPDYEDAKYNLQVARGK